MIERSKVSYTKSNLENCFTNTSIQGLLSDWPSVRLYNMKGHGTAHGPGKLRRQCYTIYPSRSRT